MTIVGALDDSSGVQLTSSAPVTGTANVFPIKSIWTTADAVRAQPRVFGSTL